MIKNKTHAGNIELIGGGLCLDFANTAGLHASKNPKENLNTYDELVEWSNHAGILSDDDARKLSRKAARNPSESERVLRGAIELREAIYSIFSSVALGTPPKREALTIFNRNLSISMAHSQLIPIKTEFLWDINGNKDRLDWMLNSVVRSAADLLTSDRLKRVKICADDRGCGWLFLDSSRNRSRRWCNMKDCGNRAKARRFYKQKQKK